MLLDSNIIIYAVQPEYKKLLDFLSIQEDIVISIITKIEVLGFYRLEDFEKENLGLFFDAIPTLKLSDEIADEAVRLRQIKKMTLGDSIIAATAICKNIPLLTNNTEDFKHINELKIVALSEVIA